MTERKRSRGRDVNGVLLLDKPVGVTSNGALQRVKRLYGARKAGHTGSLDPLASGLLPVCFGQATKVSPFLLDADKHYRVRARLGIRTDTADADGRVLARAEVPPISRETLTGVLERFVGDIEQLPPMYSAVKHQGRRLYELARDGIEVERQRRSVRIHTLRLLAREGDELELDIRCSKGTYVRTLVEDIAVALGTVAHVTRLRRLSVGPYETDASSLDDTAPGKHPQAASGPEGTASWPVAASDPAAGAPTAPARMYSLESLQALAETSGLAALDAVLLPLDTAIAHWPSVRLAADSAFYLRNGQPVQVPRAPTRGLVRLYADDAFIGMGRITDDGRVAPKRLFQ